ncbi:uncharacterized protein LOC142172175 [Nicotiana tabacum]|uniref:Uncharacterized protein LOC142172175 n=1 Tax=Nicotiana tabacum TaxID=4097 RepID=A0AC58T4B2_TOBAC|nr:uncharacterized protein LOC108947126 [Nicotiana tomentosiformis]
MNSLISCSRLLSSSNSLWMTPPSISTCIKLKAQRQVVNARFEHNQGESKPVDENMIVLRIRIKEMKLLEAGKIGPPSNWMRWEKKYFAHYKEDVYEAIGLIQMYLIETRPALALGMLALLCLSVPFSTYVLILHVMDITKSLSFHV